MELNKIYNMDAFEGLKLIPDKSVDMVFTDPPYGTTRNEWDVPVDFELFWQEIKRITKRGAPILMFSQLPFTAKAVMSNPQMFRYEWIVEKGAATGFLNARRMPLKAHENVLVFYDSLPVYNPQKTEGKAYKRGCNGTSDNYNYFKPIKEHSYPAERFPRDVLHDLWRHPHGKIYHPTQKPVLLCEYFIKTYSNEGAIVLDPFMGSGTTALAAINTNRQFIGFEKGKEYFDIAQDRINQAMSPLVTI